MSMPLREGKAIQEPAQFPLGQAEGRWACCGPLKRSPFQSAIVEPETRMIPLEDFEFVPFAIAEHKQGRGERVQCKLLLDEGGQTVNGFSHVCRAAGQVNL